MPGKDKWKPSHNPWLVAVSVMIATFMEVMDTSIASVAVPYIAGSTASTNDEAEWVLTVYLVSNAVFLVASTWFAEKFGRKRFLIYSVAVFTVASLACGLAPSLPLILLARVVQGAAGGALQPLALAILVESFPAEKQGQAMGLYALGVVLAPVIGPTLGGFLTDAVSWRWAFYINVPVGIVACILQSRFLEDPPYIQEAKPGKLDRLGFVLLGLWVGCMQFILDKGQEDDWFGNASVRWAFGIMLVTLALFLAREFTHSQPLVNLRALRNRNLSVGCVLVFVLGVAIYSLTTTLPVFFQTLMHYDATAAGLAVSPRGIGSIVASVGVGAVVAKLDVRCLISAGYAILALSTLWLGLLTLDISPITLFWPITISGFAITMVFVPLSSAALNTMPQQEVGNASSLYNFLRNVGGSVGISAGNTIAQRHLQTHRNENIHWLSGGVGQFHSAFELLTREMRMHAGPGVVVRRVWAMIQQGLDSQAQLWAYVDDFRYIALLCALCVPLAFFLKRSSGSKAAA